MPKVLWKFGYSAEGVKGLLKDGGSARRVATQKAIESLGGRLEAYYFAFGDTDVYIIADMPDAASTAALALTAGASGTGSAKTTVLLTPEDVDAAVRKSPMYVPPGG